MWFLLSLIVLIPFWMAISHRHVVVDADVQEQRNQIKLARKELEECKAQLRK